MALVAQYGGARAFTMEEVAKHNTKEDLWVVVDGKVLDLTKFVATHPGGAEPVMKKAGQDASMVFRLSHPPGTLEAQEGAVLIGYTFEEVAKHNKKDDLWAVVEGKVCNLTQFASIHPGGEATILMAAGKDATGMFQEKHAPGTLEQYAAQVVIGHPNAKSAKGAAKGGGFLASICGCICGGN